MKSTEASDHLVRSSVLDALQSKSNGMCHWSVKELESKFSVYEIQEALLNFFLLTNIQLAAQVLGPLIKRPGEAPDWPDRGFTPLNLPLFMWAHLFSPLPTIAYNH